MDLSTRYLGFDLPHPFMPGASPFADDLDAVKCLEDAGAAAIVLNSLFEEQIVHEQVSTAIYMDNPAHSFAEALTYLPEPDGLKMGPERYLDKLRRIKEAVDVPVIASLNGTTLGRWLEYASLLEEAGADAIELNMYYLATDPHEGAAAIEKRTAEIVGEVSTRSNIPIAIKLSPFFSALSHFARKLEESGAAGLVIFNRFYQPDIDIEELEVEQSLHLSTSDELLLRLRWLAILSAQRNLSFAVTGGVHTETDAVKAVMSGADAIQVVSALLHHGPEHLATLRSRFEAWLVEHEYESLAQMRGSMSLTNVPDASAYERANYMKILQSWRSEF